MGYGPAFNRRVDSNHAEVRDEYRRLGCYVKDVSGGKIGDLFVVVGCLGHCAVGPQASMSLGVPLCRYTKAFFVEVKKDAKEPLTENEKEWALLLGDQFVIVRSLEDVRNSIKG